MADEVVDLETLLARWKDEVSIEEQLRGLGDDEAAGAGGAGEAAGAAGAGGDTGHDWVSLAEAEARAGVSRSTLRAWYRGGHIPSRLTPGPHGMHRLVPLDLVLARAARSPRVAPEKEPQKEPPVSPSPPLPLAAAAASDVVRLAELAVQEARERATAAERRAEAAEQALREAIERAAAAEALLRERGGRPN